jgi:hypothetical protein
MTSKHSKLKWSTQQLQAYIRSESIQSVNVVFTIHALKRMKERKITNSMAFETLRNGKINLRPEINYAKGNVECRMEYFVAGKEIKMVVALDDDDPYLLLITAF